jgi:hypothetical protein
MQSVPPFPLIVSALILPKISSLALVPVQVPPPLGHWIIAVKVSAEHAAGFLSFTAMGVLCSFKRLLEIVLLAASALTAPSTISAPSMKIVIRGMDFRIMFLSPE